MRICLDTNAYARIVEKRRELWAVVAEAERVYVPTVVLGELYAGFECGTRCEENREILNRFLELPGVDVIPMEQNMAMRYGIVYKQLKKTGRMIPANDLWVAVTALETGARLITYDRHFLHVPGLALISP